MLTLASNIKILYLNDATIFLLEVLMTLGLVLFGFFLAFKLKEQKIETELQLKQGNNNHDKTIKNSSKNY